MKSLQLILRQFSNREFDTFDINQCQDTFHPCTYRLIRNAARRERTMVIRNSYLNGASDKGKNS